MKTLLNNIRRAGRGGHALLIALLATTLSMVIVAATTSRTMTSSKINERNNRYTAGLYAAEAATEKALARMKADFLMGNLAYVTNNLALYRAGVPTPAENPYWNRFTFSDACGNADKTYVNSLSTMVYTNLESQYAGLNGWQTKYRVISNTRDTQSSSPITCAVQQDIEMDNIPIFQFAIFYNDLLEFTWAAPMTVGGRTHANAHVYVGSACDLTFKDTLTAAGQVTKKAWDGKTVSQYTGRINYNGSPGYSTNCQVLELPIGTNNTPEAVREIANMPPGARPNGPPTGESVDSLLGKERYYNKAAVVLLVSNSTVTVSIKNQPDDTSPKVQVASYTTSNYGQIATKFPFLTITNKFTDQREGKLILATEVDVAKLSTWMVTNTDVTAKFPNSAGIYNAGLYPNILYTADMRTTTAAQLTGIRLVNGQTIPANKAPSGLATGFTIATPNPMYVKGHYNCPNNSHLGTLNTSATYPASLISDALTILSANWLDSKSGGNFASRDAKSTTINAAIITGIVYSTGSGVNDFSGGVMNLPRLLEDWGNGSASIVLTLNTSIVNLFDSVQAVAQFKNPGVYYYAPTRQFSFDQNFRDYSKLPPGTPCLGVAYRSKWCVPPPGVTTYAGR